LALLDPNQDPYIVKVLDPDPDPYIEYNDPQQFSLQWISLFFKHEQISQQNAFEAPHLFFFLRYFSSLLTWNVLFVDELGDGCGVQFAALREVRVAADLAAHVELGLAVPRQVDGPRRDVDVHQPAEEEISLELF